MKIFFHKDDIPELNSRSYLSEWIKPLFPNSRHELYGLKPEELELSETETDTDAFVLPLSWNYYFEHGKLKDALALIKEYEQWNKPVYTWAGGDHTYNVPDGNFILFRHCGYQSLRRKNEHAYPVIIRDPLEYLNLKDIKILEKETKLKIGFCGLADRNWFEGGLRSVKISIFKLINSYNKPFLDLSHPISGTRLRRNVLKLLSDSKEIETDFIIRSSSGGQNINPEKYKTEYWQNMLTSPYSLCVRGAGNYSARFYEALAMGRIPVLVNTDCILPLDDEIDWKQHCIWVEDYELDNIINKIDIFHRKLSNDNFKQLQIQNRRLWIDKLTYYGFYKSFNSKYEA